jgi:hypothetical protein
MATMAMTAVRDPSAAIVAGPAAGATGGRDAAGAPANEDGRGAGPGAHWETGWPGAGRGVGPRGGPAADGRGAAGGA